MLADALSYVDGNLCCLLYSEILRAHRPGYVGFSFFLKLPFLGLRWQCLLEAVQGIKYMVLFGGVRRSGVGQKRSSSLAYAVDATLELRLGKLMQY